MVIIILLFFKVSESNDTEPNEPLSIPKCPPPPKALATLKALYLHLNVMIVYLKTYYNKQYFYIA